MRRIREMRNDDCRRKAGERFERIELSIPSALGQPANTIRKITGIPIVPQPFAITTSASIARDPEADIREQDGDKYAPKRDCHYWPLSNSP